MSAQAFGTITHDEVHLVIRDGDVHFGRAPSNEIRIGHAPILDDIVPRNTGWITAHRGRLLVANADDRLAFDVVVDGHAPIAVRPGIWVSPLDAYVAPVIGGGSPASHQQVAHALGVSRSLVRLECNRIWSKMLLAGIPMRELTDTRDQIVDAWTRHRL
jgi:hypothetical protein